MAADAATAVIDRLAAGPLAVSVRDGALRVCWQGVEVVRLIDCPIRDADWRTLPVEETAATAEATPDGFRYARRFRTEDGALEGHLDVTGTGSGLTARLALAAVRPMRVNRAGFVLLHPIAGVAGSALAVRHPDGRAEATRFPDRISPGQPVRDIAHLAHTIDGVAVAIDFEGEVFEMEDQRNWTDASFKTYCRPLALPRPYDLAAGTTVRQAIRLSLGPAAGRPAATPRTASTATMPEVTLAHEPGAHEPGLTGPVPANPDRPRIGGLLLRVDARRPDLARPLDAPVTLEIVADDAGDVAAVAQACHAAGLAPARVIALPRGYLASHQPEGPWPDAPTPADLVAAVRAAFPEAEAGGGMLTNFTEFNRCPPDPAAIDFATFGTTAIVHAADDRAVIETLEALPAVFASAAALVPGRPLRLGLVAIGMRSNPYGAAVAPNPDRQRRAMAMDDPRQATGFAAAFAIAATATAARAGVASLAPAMTAGPLGLGPRADWPIAGAVAALADLAGQRVTIDAGAGLVMIRGARRTLAANLGTAPARVDGLDVPPLGFATGSRP